MKSVGQSRITSSGTFTALDAAGVAAVMNANGIQCPLVHDLLHNASSVISLIFSPKDDGARET